jgi:flavin-dependent dehydrogenase
MTPPRRYDVAVVGGGPAGSAAATVLADGGAHVALFEREVFPRFHVGESLMPATMLLLDRLGARDAVERAGFQVKYGATFHDLLNGRSQTFFFLPDMPWPSYAFQVPRAEFDTLLLDNARKHGVDVFQPATVARADFDADGVTLQPSGDASAAVRARLLVDASGRDGFLAARHGRRERIPNLGKVALFAHFRGAARAAGRAEGNIRIYVAERGWFWWIPLAGNVTSVGAVLHARTVRDWTGALEDLFEAVVRDCPAVAGQLAGAARITPVHRAANFAYRNAPVVGDRFVAVGDAITFVDPIFSGGVFIALHSGVQAAEAILLALADDRFEAARFAAYERRMARDVAPLFKFIHKYYEPAFFEVFMGPKDLLGVYRAVLNVLSGGSFFGMTWRVRGSLAVLFAIARVNGWVRRLRGRPVESRLEW